MARPRKATAVLGSIDECTDALRMLLLATTDLERLTAERDATAAAVMKPYEKRLADATARAKDLELQLQNYYMSHLPELEKDGKRSLQLTYGTMGRRWSPPSLRLLNKSWTWAAVRDAVRKRLGNSFLRFADPELDKEKVKEKIAEDLLAEYGLKLHREEAFYVELNRPEA